VITAVPAETPVTTPLLETVATPVLPLLHVPLAGEPVSVVVANGQIGVVPPVNVGEQADQRKMLPLAGRADKPAQHPQPVVLQVEDAALGSTW